MFIEILKFIYNWLHFHCNGKASLNVAACKYPIKMKSVLNGPIKRCVGLICPVTQEAHGFMVFCFFATDPSVVNPTSFAVYFGEITTTFSGF